MPRGGLMDGLAPLLPPAKKSASIGARSPGYWILRVRRPSLVIYEYMGRSTNGFRLQSKYGFNPQIGDQAENIRSLCFMRSN